MEKHLEKYMEKGTERNFCICILFNKDLTKTLLIKKAKGKLFEGMYNGLGGKIELGETAQQACIREIWEETDNLITLTDPQPIATLHFPHETPINLHAFYDIVEEIDLPENREGKSFWLPLDFLLDFNNKQVVGYGNLAYFCRIALRYINNQRD